MSDDKQQYPLLSLTIEQQKAIDLLMTGLSDREVAEPVGVARETVTRRRNRHPAFRAELNGRRRALWDQGLDRMRRLFPEAVEGLRNVVKDPANKNAPRVAMEIVKMAHLPECFVSSSGPQEPLEVINDEARRRNDGFKYSDPPADCGVIPVVEELEGILADDSS